MPSTFSPDLRIELMANGGNSGTWGTITNTNLGTLIEDAISGLANVSITSAAQALTIQDGAADQARCAAFNLTTTTTAAFAAYVPPVTKLYVVKNSSIYTATVYASTVAGNTTAAGTGVAIPAGRTVIIRCDGTNIIDQLDYISGNLTIGGNQTITGNLAVTGTTAFTGIPTGPTAAGGTNTTQLATTAFANAAATQAAISGGTLTGAQNYAPPVTIASAATVDIGAAASNIINVTGTTTITSFGTIAAGAVRIVNFQGALILTYNATSLILPGGASIATAANDVGVFQSLGSGNWKCVSYSQAASLGGVPAGTIITVAMPTAPSGYLKANGAAVSRTTYASLFAAIGIVFGAGDGSTTFNLPDLRGRFIRNWADDNGTYDPGRTFGSGQTDAFQNFTGDASFVSGGSGTTLIAGTSGAITTSGSVGFAPTGSAGFAGARTLTVNPSIQAGVRTSTETRPTNVALLACIKF